tara:strand:- start:741 stop:1427 length:687 start_codon:yes stop_codon:yes gene_type:complete
MQINGLFQTPVAEYVLEGDTEELDNGLTNFILGIEEAEKIENNPQFSVAGVDGYQTKGDLLQRNNPFMEEFAKRLSGFLAEYYAAITNGGELPPNSLCNSWGNIYRKGTTSVVHTHPEANMAVTYYPRVPKDLQYPNNRTDAVVKNLTLPLIPDGSFVVNDPRPCARYDSAFAHNSSIGLPPIQGGGFIIPGWLEHFVVPHYTDDLRICISTNVVVPKGLFTQGGNLE